MAKKGGGKVKETAEEKELARIASEMAADFDTRWKPIRNEFIADVKDDSETRAQALGIANVENKVAYDKVKKQTEKSQTLSGARPGSGRFAQKMSDVALEEGVSAGSTAADVNQAVTDSKNANLLSLARMGRGQQGMAMRGLSDVADMAVKQSYLNAQNSLADSTALQQAVGTAAGLGAGMYANSGTPGVQTAADPTIDPWNAQSAARPIPIQ